MASFLNRDEKKDLESLSSKIAGSIKEVKRLYTEAFYLAKDHGGVAKRISDTLSLMPDIQSKYNKILNRTLNEKQKELNKILDIKNSYAKINDQLLRSQRVLENLSNLKDELAVHLHVINAGLIEFDLNNIKNYKIIQLQLDRLRARAKFFSWLAVANLVLCDSKANQ
jgi:hypothetical protein